MRHTARRRPPFRPAIFLAFLAASTLAAAPPFPGKRGPLAPRYGRMGSSGPGPISPFRAGARAPVQGAQTIHVLALRVAFSDTPIDSSSAYYSRLLLFLNQYWSQVSDGQVTLQTTLWDSVFTLPQPLAYYGDDDRFQERLVHLVRDAVEAADSTVDFRLYQSLVLFHAGVGQEADVRDDSRDAIWSAFVTEQDFADILPDTTGSGEVGIATNDPIAPGVPYRVKMAVEVPEVESQDGYIFGMTGVLVHEFGHQLGPLRGRPGVPDLYDTTPGEGGYSQGLGAWDIMAGGVWNANGFVPAGPSVWTKAWLGFVTPERVTASGPRTVAMLERPIGAYPRALEIPITQSESFLIENRQHDPDGDGKFTFDDANQDGCFDFYTDSYAGAEFDFFLPANMDPPSGEGCDAGTYRSGSGVLIYHVDEAKIEAGLADNVVEGDTQRKGIDLEEADGIQDLDDPPTVLNPGSPDDVFRAGYRDRFTPDTEPSSSAYPDVWTGISVTDIGPADSVMTMTIDVDRTKPGWPKTLTGRIRNMPSVAADLDGDGALELIVPVALPDSSGSIYVFRSGGTNFLDGSSAPAPFAVTASAPSSSPCVGDIDGTPGPEVVVHTLNGAIYAFRPILDLGTGHAAEVMDGDNDPSTNGVLVPPVGSAGTHAQPILADLNGDGPLEVIVGGPPDGTGVSLLRVATIQSSTLQLFEIPMGASTETPAAAIDLDADGLAEVVLANVPTVPSEAARSGLSLVNWEILNAVDSGTLPSDDPDLFRVVSGGPFSAPVLADLNRDARFETIVADAQGNIHAIDLVFAASHLPADPPAAYIHAEEIAGWPVRVDPRGRISEVSLGDLEGEGYAEVFHTGDQVRVAGLHWNGAPRAGFPLRPAAPFADSDSAGFWPPLIADLDRDGVKDVIPILPDGRRPGYRADGAPIPHFVELGSTGPSAPPLLLDLDQDGSAEWAEAYDLDSLQTTVTLRTPLLPVRAVDVVWGQYRRVATRNAVQPTGSRMEPGGTRNLTAVYAYPNPSRTGRTTIHYRLADAAQSVSVRILDPAGATVAELPVTSANLAGSAEHAVFWDHSSAASGVYLCRVEVHSSRGTEVEFTRLALIR